MSEISDLIKLAQDQEWEASKGNNHWKLTPPWTADSITVSASSSDHRAFYNALSDLRKAGLIYPADAWKKERRLRRKIERLRSQRADAPQARAMVRTLLHSARLEGHAFDSEQGVDAMIWLMAHGEATGVMKTAPGLVLPHFPERVGAHGMPVQCECGITFSDPSTFAIHCYDHRRKTHRFGHEPLWAAASDDELAPLREHPCPVDGCSHVERGESDEECWYAMTAHLTDAHPAEEAADAAPAAPATPAAPQAPPGAPDDGVGPATLEPDATTAGGRLADARSHALGAAESLAVLDELQGKVPNLDVNAALANAVVALARAQTAIALALTQDPSDDDEKSG